MPRSMPRLRSLRSPSFPPSSRGGFGRYPGKRACGAFRGVRGALPRSAGQRLPPLGLFIGAQSADPESNEAASLDGTSVVAEASEDEDETLALAVGSFSELGEEP